ncbi:ferritin-like domain-containing protein [Microbacterium sp. GXS0129]|jgi:ferritin-like metal-binding protein YciE|uniref:YciE/YciF ferroxidase family protein n=1 Tax=Microbacterium sp. GXS0129 TaxID=3377836 RepID=UPI00383BB2E7
MVQQTLDTPDQLVHFQLRTALTMEHDSLAAVQELAGAARSADIKKLFRHHADETREQIENLGKVFEALELKQSTSPSPSTKGISKQAGSLIERSAPKLRDQVALSAALGNEHYEIAAYTSLIVPLTALGATEAVALLQENLDQETHTSEELLAALRKLTGEG